MTWNLLLLEFDSNWESPLWLDLLHYLIYLKFKTRVACLVFNAERVTLSRLQRISHSTQTARYTHVRRIRLLFAKRQSGIFRLRVGCANTQLTSGISSPVPQGSGKDKWYTTTNPEMTAGAGNQTRISRSQASTLNHWTISDSMCGWKWSYYWSSMALLIWYMEDQTIANLTWHLTALSTWKKKYFLTYMEVQANNDNHLLIQWMFCSTENYRRIRRQVSPW